MNNLRISLGDIEQITMLDDINAYFDKESSQGEEIKIPAIDTEKFDSSYFQQITNELKIIMDHIRRSETDIYVRIVCPNTDVRDYYMMVYNYWYAAEKSDRIMSDSWD